MHKPLPYITPAEAVAAFNAGAKFEIVNSGIAHFNGPITGMDIFSNCIRVWNAGTSGMLFACDGSRDSVDTRLILAEPAADADGWIKWDAKPDSVCPVAPGAMVEVRFRYGGIGDGLPGACWGWHSDKRFGDGGDIVAYRLLPSEPAKDDGWIAHTGTECPVPEWCAGKGQFEFRTVVCGEATAARAAAKYYSWETERLITHWRPLVQKPASWLERAMDAAIGGAPSQMADQPKAEKPKPKLSRPYPAPKDRFADLFKDRGGYTVIAPTSEPPKNVGAPPVADEWKTLWGA